MKNSNFQPVHETYRDLIANDTVYVNIITQS